MKKNRLVKLAAAFLLGLPLTAAAQQIYNVDRTKYPDYSEQFNPDWSLMPSTQKGGEAALARTRSQRPDHVNNAETRHFPPVFNQDGGSCGSASRISYMFSYEFAAYRDLDGSKAENYYPSHFVWLHTNSPTSPIDQGKDAFVTAVGVPSAATYGGQTYSSTFGNQDCSNEDFGWMQGYDKWFEAMHNRMLRPSNFPINVGTEEGREAVKNWLWNHNGDDSFAAGGICGIGVASGGDWQNIAKTENNEKIGVAGMKYVHKWGTQVDHALTIVGYDDRIEFDLDGDGVYGEADADELGAWIIVNSWGAYWCNGGFIYCPYAHAVPAFTSNGNPNGDFWMPEIYRVRKDYRPLRTIKLEMEYSRRSEIALSAGISADINATAPEKTVSFVHFTYAGDGNYGNSNPAPEVPMLGRWADGKLHTEPMEFGYDLTDLTDGYDVNRPLKYFFIINTKSWAQGEGTIHNASIMDYISDMQGIETPFAVGDGVEVKNAGGKTIISVIVQGGSYYAPLNVSYANNTLKWQAPSHSPIALKSYRIYADGVQLADLPSTTESYTPEVPASEYAVSAIYTDGKESSMTVVRTSVQKSNPNTGVQFNNSGFTIPGVFATKYNQATIEYWIKPNSLRNWNQSGGPGWGTFMFHANADGQYTVGWDTSNRMNTGTYTRLSKGKWTHVAVVIDGNTITTYLDGTRRGDPITSQSYSGIGGFGDLVFSSNGEQNSQDAVYDEIRIWNVARSGEQIKANKNVEYTGDIMPQGLIAYLKGDLFTNAEGITLMRDCAGGHHATLTGNSYTAIDSNMSTLNNPSGNPTVSINSPNETVYAGIPTTFKATHNEAVNRLAWTAQSANVENITVESPTLTFATAGTHAVSVTATSASGKTATATLNVTVQEAPTPDATFTMTTNEAVPAGERITFHAKSPQVGYIYQWNMPGADTPTGTSPSIATSYQTQGTYKVTLTVTAPNGTKKSHSETIKVIEVAPVAAFSISPAVVLKGETVTLNDESLYTPLTRKWLLTNGGINYIVYADANTLAIDQPGVYNVTLDVANNSGTSSITRERALIVTNADSKNGLLFSNDAATVTTNQTPLTTEQAAWTIDWWMNSQWPIDNINGIGESDETMLIKTMGGGKMQLSIGGKNVTTSNDYVIANEWHHYAVSFANGNVKFYRDGEVKYTRTLSATLPEIKNFRIGGTAAPFKGSIDELRVWGSTLTDEQLRNHANAPIENVTKAEIDNKLVLYYNFNQSGGDVQDATSKENHGTRTNFGPDGDAWGLSKGVFCLSSSEIATSDITSSYLTNYAKPFADSKKCINSNLSSRAFGLTGWTMENAITNGNITTGAHVDYAKNKCLTITTTWDGFVATLNDHKVFQTITLPAGFYTFTAEYDATYEGQCGGSYLVAAEGNSLPATENINEAVAYTAMKQKGAATSNSVSFVLTEETTISLGILVNMSGSLCMTVQKFTLAQSQVMVVGTTEEIPSHIEVSTVAIAPTAIKGIYDLMGRRISINSQHVESLAPGIYLIDGRKVVVK